MLLVILTPENSGVKKEKYSVWKMTVLEATHLTLEERQIDPRAIVLTIGVK